MTKTEVMKELRANGSAQTRLAAMLSWPLATFWFPASILMLSPLSKSPARSFCAKPLIISRCMIRFSGRAPKTGS